MITTIIINEQHSLLPVQKKLLEDTFGSWETLLVPSTVWNKDEQEAICSRLEGVVIFISPIPYMIKLLSMDAAANVCCVHNKGDGLSGISNIEKVFIMSNDVRDKKELPNGRVIYTVAKEGWYLA